MALSPKEQRVLGTVERDLADAEPFLNYALASMRVPLGYRITARSATGRRRVSCFAGYGWLALILGGLLTGIGLLWVGLMLGIPSVAIPCAALAQITPIGAGWLARWLARRRKRSACEAINPDTGRNASTGR